MRRGQYVAAARRGVGEDGAGSFRCGGVLAVFSGGVNIIWIRYLVAKYDRFVGARRNLRRRGVASVGRNPRLSSPNWGCGLRLSAPMERGAPAIVDKFSGQEGSRKTVERPSTIKRGRPVKQSPRAHKDAAVAREAQ